MWSGMITNFMTRFAIIMLLFDIEFIWQKQIPSLPDIVGLLDSNLGTRMLIQQIKNITKWKRNEKIRCK